MQQSARRTSVKHHPRCRESQVYAALVFDIQNIFPYSCDTNQTRALCLEGHDDSGKNDEYQMSVNGLTCIVHHGVKNRLNLHCRTMNQPKNYPKE